MVSVVFIKNGEAVTLEIPDFFSDRHINQRAVFAGLGHRDNDEDMRRVRVISDKNSVWAYTIFSSVGVGVALSTLSGDLEDNLYAMIPCVLGCVIAGSLVAHMITSGMPNHQFMENHSHIWVFMISLFPWLVVSSLEYVRYQSGHPEPIIR